MEFPFASKQDVRDIKSMLHDQAVSLVHFHDMLHAILAEVVNDPVKLDALKARLKASADTLKQATKRNDHDF